MSKRFLFSIFFSAITICIFATTLPKPANNQMYTEYTSEKKLKYVKNPIIATGKIIMFDENYFIFTQDSPVSFKVTKKSNIITYKRPNSPAMQFDANDSSFANNNDLQIMSFFGNDSQIEDFYNIKVTNTNNLTNYQITPKSQSKIKEMQVSGYDDKILTLLIVFSDNSTLKYTFSNTITGVKPNYEDTDK